MTAFGMCLPGMLTIGEKNGTNFVTADDAYFDHFARLLSCIRVSGNLQNTTEPAGTSLSSILALVNGAPFSHQAKALSAYSTPLLSSCLCVASPAPDHQTCFTIATTSVSSECAPETFVSDTCEQPSRIAYEARLFIHIIFLRCQK